MIAKIDANRSNSTCRLRLLPPPLPSLLFRAQFLFRKLNATTGISVTSLYKLVLLKLQLQPSLFKLYARKLVFVLLLFGEISLKSRDANLSTCLLSRLSFAASVNSFFIFRIISAPFLLSIASSSIRCASLSKTRLIVCRQFYLFV